MSAKADILEYQKANPIFRAKEAAEATGLNISTVRSAIRDLITDGKLFREGDTLAKPKVARKHKKPTIASFISPSIAAALDDVNIHDKKACKAALESITLETEVTTTDEEGNETQMGMIEAVKALKPFSVFKLSHLDWYKSQYLRGARKANPETAEQTASRIALPALSAAPVVTETTEVEA